MPIGEFQSELVALFEGHRSRRELDDFRLSAGPWKKLADEVSPVSQFLRYSNVKLGSVHFPLDSHPPDCWLCKHPNADPIGVEVTVALGRERYHLASEMVRKGVCRGFIGKQDDAPQSEFDAAMSRSRVTYTTEHALRAVKDGVLKCICRKNHLKFEGYTLLIEAPLVSLPQGRWIAIEDELRQAASRLPFAEVHVISDAHENPWGIRIK